MKFIVALAAIVSAVRMTADDDLVQYEPTATPEDIAAIQAE